MIYRPPQFKETFGGAHDMCFIPGTNVTRVMTGIELAEAKSSLRLHQRISRMRWHERAADQHIQVAGVTTVSDCDAWQLDVSTPVIIIEPDNLRHVDFVPTISVCRTSCLNLDVHESESMPTLVPELNFSSVQWDPSEELSICSSDLTNVSKK